MELSVGMVCVWFYRLVDFFSLIYVDKMNVFDQEHCLHQQKRPQISKAKLPDLKIVCHTYLGGKFLTSNNI